MKKKIIIGAAVLLLLGALITALLFYTGVLLFNNPSREEYPVRGVDVSSYQGEIDWQILSKSGIDFAFIKATEGSSAVDPCFQSNWEGAFKTDLRIGAYHFFSYDSPGLSQAENFISVVPKSPLMLPPVVDVEFYGDKEQNPPDKAKTEEELTALLKALTQHYGVKPILYATEKSYSLYIADSFREYDIWIRNVLSAPTLSDGRGWTFWQYTNRGRLSGYQGEESYIDINVFAGNREEFLAYPEK